MKIANIYEEYKIPQILQTHMYRVAAVASLICNNWKGEIDRDTIVHTALLHDMGNIIKFNMSFMPEVFEPEGVDYWTGIKQEFIEKYGGNEHDATYKIIDEIGVERKVVNLIKSLDFGKAKEGYESESFEIKIPLYSDQRVTPIGVTSLEERISEGYKRYLARKDWPKSELEKFPILSDYLRKIEAQIFEKCKLEAMDITDGSVEPIMKELKDFEIITK